MAKPVTRAELRKELSRYPTKEYLRKELAKHPTRDELRAELAKYATKAELRAEVAKLATKDELRAEVAKLATKDELRAEVDKLSTAIGKCATKQDLETWGHALYARLSADVATQIAHFATAIEESTRNLFVALDDKYKDLPERVARLEARND